MHAEPTETGMCQIPCKWSYRWLKAAMWVLGTTTPGFSGRAVNEMLLITEPSPTYQHFLNELSSIQVHNQNLDMYRDVCVHVCVLSPAKG